MLAGKGLVTCLNNVDVSWLNNVDVSCLNNVDVSCLNNVDVSCLNNVDVSCMLTEKSGTEFVAFIKASFCLVTFCTVHNAQVHV